MRRKRRVLTGCVMGLLLAGLGVGTAHAMSATEGTIITNVATASYNSSAGPTAQFWVSYAVTATVLVSNPALQLQKTAAPTLQSSGGTVVFTIMVVNTSAQASAFNIVVNDRLPDWMCFVGGSSGVTFSPSNPAPTPALSNTTTGFGSAVWAMNHPATNWCGLPAPGKPLYLRWTLEFLGPGKSAWIYFQATVM